MKLMDKLFNGKGYIDGITIIDLAGEILFTAKFNNKLTPSPDENYEIIGKKFLEVYENLSEKTSSTYQAMTLGMPVYKENQILKSKDRKEINISSLSIPIKSGNRIVGAIDLSVSENEEIKKTGIEVQDISTTCFNNNNVITLSQNNYNAKYTIESIITKNRHMKELKKYIHVAASCNLPTLIYGETGTGKELFAHAIHNASTRKSKPFISQNCAAIPENLLESILFGTSKGAFTGAIDNIGLLEIANGGTLLLDEINSMPIHLQSKLLRVLEEGVFRRIGAKDETEVDIKIIAAINEEPLKCIEKGLIRRDIYYRLSSMHINIPPLKDRKDDIPALINFMILKHNKIFGKNIKYVSKEILDNLNHYHWPGNIRELENVIIYGLSMADKNQETLNYEDIEKKMKELMYVNTDESIELKPLTDMIQNYEKELIQNALIKTDFNVSHASKILSVPRQTLQRKAKGYNLI